MIARTAGVFVLLWLCAGGFSAEPQVADKEMPRFAPVEPKDAIATMRIREGFRVELAACEPNVVDPVALSFDENGRMFVVEMRDYSERRDEKLGRIRMLEDVDGDGVFEKSTIFADGLPWPTAVFCWDGGVFVGCTPDILYLKDTDGDGRADVKQVVYTGFAAGMARLNVQALLNSFNWGLDNRIHGAASFSGGKITRPGTNAPPLDLRGKGFAFDPRSGEIMAENGGGQHGLSFDDWGRMYVCSNSEHIMTFAYDYALGQRDSGYHLPPPLLHIAVDGGAAEVYRVSPEEPWRIIRTKWRVNGLVPGPVEGGGRSAGYFTGATGITIYRGDAYGPGFEGDAFIGDAGGNLVHRKKIYPDGPIVKAQRPAEEQKREFLASTDTWFRPVQFANAPDGCLYVLDMYRQTIEHPWSLPESLKKHLDLNAGNDRGRIYRIVPGKFARRMPPRLGSASMKELVATLAHSNGWHRDTAARLIFQRQDKAAVPLLEDLLAGPSALGRMHALHALDGLGSLQPKHLERALSDRDEHVRFHAIGLIRQKFEQSKPPEAIGALLAKCADDSSIQVRFELALTLGALGMADPQLLLRIEAHDPSDPWIEAAVLYSTGNRRIEMFQASLAGGGEVRRLAPRLAELIGEHDGPRERDLVAAAAIAERDAAPAMAIARALADGMHLAGASFGYSKLIDRARQFLEDSKAQIAVRCDAVGVLGRTTWDSAEPILLPLLDARQPGELSMAAVAALDALDQGQFARQLLSRWSRLSPALRESAVIAMVKRPARAKALLDAIEAGKIHPGELSAANRAALHHSADPSIKQRATQLLASVDQARQKVIDSFTPAISMQGNPRHGHELYVAKCISCHRLKGEGNALGPDLETVKSWDREKLLANILDPNREVAPNYAAYLLQTSDGDSQIGIIASETPATITLRMAWGQQTTIQRRRIKSLRAAGMSMMPQGLEEGLKPADFADLMAYIQSDQPPLRHPGVP